MSDLTTKQFVARESITIECLYADNNPHMDSDQPMNHYKCKLSRKTEPRKRLSMTVYFSMGLGLSGEPTAVDVLDSLAADAAGIENARGSFEDWCVEYGYDTDSRKAERTYRICQKQAASLKQFLGDDAYDQLLWHTERQ